MRDLLVLQAECVSIPWHSCLHSNDKGLLQVGPARSVMKGGLRFSAVTGKVRGHTLAFLSDTATTIMTIRELLVSQAKCVSIPWRSGLTQQRRGPPADKAC